jgi:hypothetical protein
MNGTAITNRLQNSFKIKDINVYGSLYYCNFRTSSFKQVACLILIRNGVNTICPPNEVRLGDIIKKNLEKVLEKKQYIPFSRLPLKIIGLRHSNRLCLSHIINKVIGNRSTFLSGGVTYQRCVHKT